MFSSGKNALSSQEPQAPSPHSFLSSQPLRVTLGESHGLSGPHFLVLEITKLSAVAVKIQRIVCAKPSVSPRSCIVLHSRRCFCCWELSSLLVGPGSRIGLHLELTGLTPDCGFSTGKQRSHHLRNSQGNKSRNTAEINQRGKVLEASLSALAFQQE